MSDCCTPRGYRWIFSERNARAEARRYRRKGLDGVSRRIVDIVTRRGVAGRSVLEVGGGVGALQLELLRAGAGRATGVELTPTYEAAAAELAAELGLEDRVHRRLGDFVDAAPDLEPADVVVMNRVVCCYPDMPRLVGLASERTLGVLVMTFPSYRPWVRAAVAVMNLGLRLTRRQFHVFVRPSDRIIRAAEDHGLRRLLDRSGLFWETVALERPAA